VFAEQLRRRATIAAALVLALVFVTGARADGEAGIVVQNGDQVTTYCVPFSGDGPTGQQLLQTVGIDVTAFGGGSGLAVCSLDATGCSDASSFSSCFCQCQGGDCTYWAFFTRQYGKAWIYSTLAFNLLKAKDGDVQGWKWGKGGANSAPAPQDITFDPICGHAPRGGALPATATPASPTALPPTSVATIASPTPGGALTSAPATAPAETAAASEAPTVTVTIRRSVVPTQPPAPQTPATGEQETKSNDSRGLGLFAVIAGGLILAIGGALFWRRRAG
jgi:hypothetical protein